MPGMPYHLEKGGWICVLEEFLNGSLEEVVSTLELLRSDAPVIQASFFRLKELRQDKVFGEDPVGHVADDWFGQPNGLKLKFREELYDLLPGDAERDVVKRAWRDAAGLNPRQRHLSVAQAAVANGLQHPFPSTGFWHNYWGDVEGIVRATIRTAIEVSLGIGAETPIGDITSSQRLPIEIFWKCPQRWWEGWVTWRDEAEHSGQVTVFLCTPSSGSPVIEAPGAAEGARKASSCLLERRNGSPSVGTTGTEASDAEAGVSDAEAGGRTDVTRSPRGMWLISHQDHLVLPPLDYQAPRPQGEWAVPDFGPAYVGLGKVEIIEPSFRHGGVRRDGRPVVTIDQEKG